MGFFQGIKDTLFLTKCATQLQHVIPDVVTADQFCNDNAMFLLYFRDQGKPFEAAVNLTCITLLHKMRELTQEQNLEESSRTMMIASTYAMKFISRWTQSEYTPAFSAALEQWLENTKVEITM